MDLVNSVTIPSSTGFTTYMDNIGEVENKGYELEFRSEVVRRKDLFVAVFANLAHNENRILKISESLKAYNDRVKDHFANSNRFDGSNTQPFTQYVEGGSQTSIWGVPHLESILLPERRFLSARTEALPIPGIRTIRWSWGYGTQNTRYFRVECHL